MYEKMDELEAIQKYMDNLNMKYGCKIAVLFSGGVDSGLVAFSAKKFSDAVTVDSEFVFRYKIVDAVNFTKKHGIKHKVVKINLNEEIKNNPINRCYLCKKSIIKEVKNLGYSIILDGTNIDDLKEIRPGIKAIEEENVISPLVELNFGKDKTKKAMYKIDNEFAFKPHESCIATRIPVNSRITFEKLKRIEKAEESIRNLGISLVRVRDYFPEARIEVLRSDLKLAIENFENILEKLKDIGYSEVNFNPEGYNGCNKSAILKNPKK